MEKNLLISTYDLKGGAARATYRLHKGLVDWGIDPIMCVQEKQSDDYRIDGPVTKLKRFIALVRPTLDQVPLLFSKTALPVPRSPSFLPCSAINPKSIQSYSPRVVHLHWVCGGALCIRSIGRIKQPIVWTMHDMWPFCGAEHCVEDGSNARFRLGYKRTNRDRAEFGIDIDKWTWKRKMLHWKNKSMFLVAPSNWLANCARESALFYNQNIRVIPNVLDTNIWKPVEKLKARSLLGLPKNKPLILFGALDGGQSYFKGADLLQESLKHLTKYHEAQNCELVIFGQSRPKDVVYDLPVHYMGHLHDDIALILLYSAADLMLLPSRIDNLPQTGTEAQTCGCPIIAFDCCGLPDVVEHKKTGFLVPPFDTVQFAQSIASLLKDKSLMQKMSKNARKRAVALWSPEVVIPQYLNVYKEASESSSQN